MVIDMRTRLEIGTKKPEPRSTEELLAALDRVTPSVAAEVLLLACAALRHPTGATISRALELAARAKGV
jgi:hypothetical protein